MKIVVENIFMCLVLFWKCYFPINFSHFLDYFLGIQTNFITKNFKITAKSQHHTPPKLQFNPQQQTPAIKSHNHQNTTTTPPQQQQKSKSQREISGSKARSCGGKVKGEIERCGAQCNRRDLVRAIVGLELEVRRRRRTGDLSLSLSARLTWKWFEVKIWASNHFHGQRLILHGQLQITSWKFIFHAQQNTHIYEKAFPKVIWSQNKHSLSCKLPI